jgi:hypothetical protein
MNENLITFTLTKNESKEYNEFCKKHINCEFTSTIGGKFSIIITPTGLGKCVEVKCKACGETKDITDIDCW